MYCYLFIQRRICYGRVDFGTNNKLYLFNLPPCYRSNPSLTNDKVKCSNNYVVLFVSLLDILLDVFQYSLLLHLDIVLLTFLSKMKSFLKLPFALLFLLIAVKAQEQQLIIEVLYLPTDCPIKSQNLDILTTDYTGTLEDGTVFDSR